MKSTGLGVSLAGPKARVLPTALVLKGIHCKDTRGYKPRFADDTWDLSTAVFRENARPGEMRIDFKAVKNRAERLAIKELLFARLQREVVGSQRIAVTTAPVIFNWYKVVAGDLRRLGLGSIVALPPKAIDSYAAWMRENSSESGCEARVGLLRMLFAYREHLSYGGLPMMPLPFERVGRKWPHENRTRRIPEEVIGPLLQWSLKYLSEFSEPVFAMLARREDRMPIARFVRGESGKETMGRYIGALNAQGLGLPYGTHGKVDWMQVARELGYSTKFNAFTPWQRRMLTGLKAHDGGRELLQSLREHAPARRLMFDPVDERVWRQAILQRVETAAYIVIAYLSGMRDSEVRSLRPGCHTVRDGAMPDTKIHYVCGQVYKNEDPEGKTESWVVTKEVGAAVAVLERLHEVAPDWARGRLFRDGARSGEGLKVFLRYLRNIAGQPNGPLAPGLMNGKDWPISTRQFRRTVAWFIANRPYGYVAGAIQFKHASVQMFQGYAGTSKAGFAQEVAQEEELMRFEAVFDRYRAWEGGATLAGGGGGRVAKIFEQVQAAAGGLKGQVADEARVRALLRNHARTLHVGPLNLCFYAAETSACRALALRLGIDGPLLAGCLQGGCSNAIVPPEWLDRWLGYRDDTASNLEMTKKRSRGRELPVIQISTLEGQLKWIDPIIACLRKEVAGEA